MRRTGLSQQPPDEYPDYEYDGEDYYDAPRRRLNLYLLLGIAVFAIASFYSGFVVVTQADEIFFPGNELHIPIFSDYVPGVDAQPDGPATIEERINIVVLGLDQRRDEPDGDDYRTDSVMVMTIDPYSKTGGVFSIPRDTLVEIPDGFGGYYEERVNTVYENGDFYDGGGAQLVKDTIEHNFGIPIDYYMILNFNNFIDLIDELDGIDVDVPAYAYDPAYNDCNYCSYYPVEFIEGAEHMDGERALAYARIRASDNDYKRIERQQVVLRAIGHRAADLGVLVNNPISLYDKYKDAVKTDISALKLPGLALLASQVGIDDVPMVSIGPATYPCPAERCGGAAMLLWDRDKVEEYKALVFSDGRLQGESAYVDVKNGTAVLDLAGEFAGFLRAQGLPAEKISVDELANNEFYNTTVIYNVTGKKYTAEKIAEWLNVPFTRIRDLTDPDAVRWHGLSPASDVIVIIGSDVDVPTIAGDSSVLAN